MKKRGKNKIYLLAAIAAVILLALAYAGFILFFRIPELMKNSGNAEFAYAYGSAPWQRIVTARPGENIASAATMTPDNLFFPREMIKGKMEFSGTPSGAERIKLFNSIPVAPAYPVTVSFNNGNSAVFDGQKWEINWQSAKLNYKAHAEVDGNESYPGGLNSLLRLFPFPDAEGEATFDWRKTLRHSIVQRLVRRRARPLFRKLGYYAGRPKVYLQQPPL